MSTYDITFLSILRDSTGYLDRYSRQLRQTLAQFEHSHVIWVEGDSTDDTPAQLRALAETLPARVTLAECPTHGPYWPSIDHPQRWQQLEYVWNTALRYLEPTRWAVCVESDLVWDWPTLAVLLADIKLAMARCCIHCLCGRPRRLNHISTIRMGFAKMVSTLPTGRRIIQR